MKPTLLQIVQRVAEYINAGTVNSIYDTRESEQIAKIVKECYFDLIERNEIEVRYSLFNLQSLSDNTKPTTLLLPEHTWTIDIIKHKDKTLTDLKYKEPMQFVEDSLYLDPTSKDVMACEFESVDDATKIKFNVRLDRHPTYYTIMYDKYLIVDSVKRDEHHTITGEEIVCYGRYFPVFELKDDFKPMLTEQQFSILLSNAKIHADYELKEHTNPLETNRAQKLFINSSNNARSYTRGPRIWNNRTTPRRR